MYPEFPLQSSLFLVRRGYFKGSCLLPASIDSPQDFLRFFLETGIDQIQRHVLDESLVIHRTISADGHATANRSRHSRFAAFTTQQNPFLGLFTD